MLYGTIKFSALNCHRLYMHVVPSLIEFTIFCPYTYMCKESEPLGYAAKDFFWVVNTQNDKQYTEPGIIQKDTVRNHV